MPRPQLLWLPWLQNLDRGLQRALNRQEFDVAQDIRTRREQVDKVLAAHLVRSQAGANAAITREQSAPMHREADVACLTFSEQSGGVASRCTTLREWLWCQLVPSC